MSTVCGDVMSVSEELDFLNIPLQCPTCGAGGWTTIHRLHRTFRCRKCGDRFFVDNRGELVAGELVRSAGSKVTKYASYWRRVPGKVRWSIVVGATVLAGFFTSRWLFQDEAVIPPTLTARAVFAGEALARAERRNLARVSTHRTADRVGALIEKARPKSWNHTGTGRASFGVEVEVVFENARTGKACVRAEIARLDAAIPSGSVLPANESAATAPAKPKESDKAHRSPKAHETAILVQFWELSANGEWLLDVATTLKGASSSRDTQ